MEKKSYDNLGHAIYAIIFLLALFLYSNVPIDPAKADSTLQIRQSFLLNLSAGLMAVALVFFVLRFYSFNPEQERVADLQAEMKAMKDLLQVLMTRSLGGKYWGPGSKSFIAFISACNTLSTKTMGTPN